MALINKLFGKRQKSLSELTPQELRREEILIGKERDKSYKKMEAIAAEKQKIFEQGAKQKSPELRKALALQFELKTQEQLLSARQLNIRGKELMTVSRVRMLRENAPKLTGALGRLNLTEKDTLRIEQWINDDAVSQEMYMERLNSILDLGAQSDKDILSGQGVGEAGSELLNIWNDLDSGAVKTDEAFKQADQAARRRASSPADAMEKNL